MGNFKRSCGITSLFLLIDSDSVNVTVSTSTAHGVSHLSGRRVRRCGSILNNIIEVKLGR